MITRYPTKKIYVGDVAVGGDAPISTQSMTYSNTYDVDATVEQIKRLHFAGCDIVRVAVPDMEDALALKAIKSTTTINLRLSLQSLLTASVLTLVTSVKNLV